MRFSRHTQVPDGRAAGHDDDAAHQSRHDNTLRAILVRHRHICRCRLQRKITGRIDAKPFETPIFIIAQRGLRHDYRFANFRCITSGFLISRNASISIYASMLIAPCSKLYLTISFKMRKERMMIISRMPAFFSAIACYG